jgi:hypothetical protein
MTLLSKKQVKYYLDHLQLEFLKSYSRTIEKNDVYISKSVLYSGFPYAVSVSGKLIDYITSELHDEIIEVE